jgi:energy-coupling factor transporter ATP-binding protein EcfA2
MDTDTTPMSFIHASARGTPRYDSRSITTPDWNDIAANYNEKASQSLAETMALTAPEGTARLLLMYGPPGTGKTTAIRALSRAWHPWCDTVVVLDPDQLFTNLDYLQATILDEPEEPTGKWTLFVIEDADEIITAKAKDLTGQALSRLLNITDGIVGQGVKALFLITTNEPVKELHPAIKRDGRCLVDIDVQPLSVAEAQKWLADRGLADVPLTEPQTIAQLYGHLTTTPVKTPPAPTPSAGQYL